VAGITELNKQGKTIFIIDYSGCKEAEMIQHQRELKGRILAFGKPVSIVSVFDGQSFVTPNFMRNTERGTLEVLHLIEKFAMVGLSDTKKMILKGYNQLIGRNVRNFDSVEEAMGFILDAKSSDK
jgi:hypothetical protein